jgi:hypothetical protein
MDAILIYFLKANGLLISFYLVYYFLLRKETFFIKSRYFLLFGLVASILLPLLTFTKTVWVEPNPIEMESAFSSVIPVSNPILVTSEISSSLNWNEIMYSVYALITIVLFLKIIIELLSFLKFIRIGVRNINANYILLDHPENQNPFSFFHYIVYNSSQFTTAELQHILEHEKIHVLQKHSLDVLLAKLFCVFFWMNPIMWFYRKEMLQNLEYIADNFASLQVSNSVNYQKTLLKVVLNQDQLTITNQFYQSLIKKRIVMLNTQKSNPRKNWKYSFLVPILVSFILVFQIETVAQIKKYTTVLEVEKPENNEEFSSIYNSPYTDNPDEKRLIVINGKPYAKEDVMRKSFGKVSGNSEIIKLTPTEGLAKYGEKGKFGVVEFPGNWKIIHSSIANTTDQTKIEEEKEIEESGTIILTSTLTKNFTETEITQLEKKFSNKKQQLNISNVKRNEKAEITTIKLSFDTNKTYNRVTEILSEKPINDIEIYVKTDPNGEIAVGFVQKKVATSHNESPIKPNSKKLTYSSGGETFSGDKLWIINGKEIISSELPLDAMMVGNGGIRELSIHQSI